MCVLWAGGGQHILVIFIHRLRCFEQVELTHISPSLGWGSS